jgi:chemotaxis protein MotA
MFAIIGIVIVFGSVVAGFLMEKGRLPVLVQPAELLIIGGAALGTLLIANPMHILKGILSEQRYGRKAYSVSKTT